MIRKLELALAIRKDLGWFEGKNVNDIITVQVISSDSKGQH